MYGSIHFGGKDVLRVENKPWPIRVGKFFFFFLFQPYSSLGQLIIIL